MANVMGMRCAWLMAVLAALAARPASAQVSLVGEWSPRYHEDQIDRIPGPDLGDYTGLPLTPGARLAADSWDAARLTLREHQCKVHISPYIYHGPLQVRIWEEKDPRTQQVIAIKNYVNTYEQERTIWMDGRAHPPPWAPHTWMGFATGTWEGDILTVYTTHIKQEWIRRNGVPNSEKSTMIEHFIRHGNIMTHVVQWTDPVYLTEPLIRTEDFVLNDRPAGNWLWPCEYVDEIPDRPHSAVPHYLPGKSPFAGEFAYKFGVPVEAANGGVETTYPEYQAKLRTLPKPTKPAPGAPNPQLSTAPPAPPRPADWGSNGEIKTFKVQGNVYLLVGAGGNIAVQAADEGVLVVDTGLAAHADKVLAAIRALSDKPIRYIINTHFHPDHTGGNETIGKAGSNVQGGPTTVISHERVLNRMSAPFGTAPARPADAWPTDTFILEEKDIFFNNEPLFIYHDASGHTDGDSMVLFRRSDVIVAGDVFVMDSYPMIDSANGGGVQGVIDGLNRLLDLAVPAHEQEGGTYIIPGHGRVCDEADVLEYRDMVTIVRDRIQDMVTRGLTLDQVKAAKPTLDYDLHYGASPRGWTTEMFVDAVYKDLSKRK